MKILFLHGKESGPGGTKPTFLAANGMTVINPALPADDFAEALRIAQAAFDEHRPEVVVGSSRGGAVALNIRTAPAGLVLLCPAWKKWGEATTAGADILILHSRADAVIPYSASEELIHNSNLSTKALIEVGQDHRLSSQDALAVMLMAARLLGEHRQKVSEADRYELMTLCRDLAISPKSSARCKELQLSLETYAKRHDLKWLIAD